MFQRVNAAGGPADLVDKVGDPGEEDGEPHLDVVRNSDGLLYRLVGLVGDEVIERLPGLGRRVHGVIVKPHRLPARVVVGLEAGDLGKREGQDRRPDVAGERFPKGLVYRRKLAGVGYMPRGRAQRGVVERNERVGILCEAGHLSLSTGRSLLSNFDPLDRVPAEAGQGPPSDLGRYYQAQG